MSGSPRISQSHVLHPAPKAVVDGANGGPDSKRPDRRFKTFSIDGPYERSTARGAGALCLAPSVECMGLESKVAC